MKRLPWARVAVALAATLAAAGCSGTGDADEHPDTVRIALMAPTSGTHSETGGSARRGAQLAVDLINDSHPGAKMPLAEERGLTGLGGARVELLVVDSGGRAGGATGEVGRLAEDGVSAVVSAGDTTESVAAASQNTERLHLPFVSGDAEPRYLTERGLEWFFRTGPTDRDVGEAFLALLETRKGHGGRQELGVVYPDDPDGRSAAFDVKSAADGAGHDATLVKVPPSEYDEDGVGDALSAVPDDVDGLVLVGGDSAQAEAATAAAADSYLGSAGVLGMGDGFTEPGALERLRKDLPDLFVGSDWTDAALGSNPNARYVTDLYREEYEEEMTAEAAAAFTATYVAARAVEDAGSAEPERVRAALEELRIPGRELIMQWDGVRFDTNQQNEAARAVITQWIGDREQLVYPTDLARTAPSWPSARKGW